MKMKMKKSKNKHKEEEKRKDKEEDDEDEYEEEQEGTKRTEKNLQNHSTSTQFQILLSLFSISHPLDFVHILSPCKKTV